MRIEEMGLTPAVQAKAEHLQRLHPAVVFTSGRRTLASQAQAMARNVLQSRSYIRETYAPSPAITKLQAWVDAHPKATQLLTVTTGLLGVLNSLTPEVQDTISRHLTGEAFDIEPGTCPIEAIESLNPRKILTHEGGLSRLHVEF